PTHAVSTWVYAIARNHCTDLARARARRPAHRSLGEVTSGAPRDTAPTPEGELLGHETRRLAAEALERLSPELRQVAFLRFHLDEAPGNRPGPRYPGGHYRRVIMRRPEDTAIGRYFEEQLRRIPVPDPPPLPPRSARHSTRLIPILIRGTAAAMQACAVLLGCHTSLRAPLALQHVVSRVYHERLYEYILPSAGEMRAYINRFSERRTNP
ncbi:unnamed protein product, partial [marine sediment metagenome]